MCVRVCVCACVEKVDKLVRVCACLRMLATMLIGARPMLSAHIVACIDAWEGDRKHYAL